jgi:alpha-1,3-glucan synthase
MYLNVIDAVNALARVGGLGQMPGWWYTIESTTTTHLIDQFEHACREALSSDRSTREVMRAISAKQRFPVIEWIRRLDKLQTTVIKMCLRSKRRPMTPTRYSLRTSFPRFGTPQKSTRNSIFGSLAPEAPPVSMNQNSYGGRKTPDSLGNIAEVGSASMNPSAGQVTPLMLPRNASSPSLTGTLNSTAGSSGFSSSNGDSSREPSLHLGSRLGPGHGPMKQIQSTESLQILSNKGRSTVGDPEEQLQAAQQSVSKTPKDVTTVEGWETDNELRDDDTPDSSSISDYDPQRASILEIYPIEGPSKSPMPSSIGQSIYPASEVTDIPSSSLAKQGSVSNASELNPADPSIGQRSAGSRLSLASVLEAREAFALTNVEEIFTDTSGKYLRQFSAELRKLDAKSSKDEHCIEEFITRSEKEWANTIRSKKLGVESLFNYDLKSHFLPKTETPDPNASESSLETPVEEMQLSPNRPTGLKLLLQRRVGDWPLYSFLLSLVSSI